MYCKLKTGEGKVISKLRKDLILYTIIAAVAAELISLPAFGPNLLFSYGLAVGACAAIIALNIISFSVERAAEKRRKNPVIFGFIIRVLLYGGALYLAVSTSRLSLFGAAIGMILPHAALYIMCVLVPAIRKKVKKEPEAMWITDTRSLLFLSEPHIVMESNGRTYLTHKHYRKIRITSDGT